MPTAPATLASHGGFEPWTVASMRKRIHFASLGWAPGRVFRFRVRLSRNAVAPGLYAAPAGSGPAGPSSAGLVEVAVQLLQVVGGGHQAPLGPCCCSSSA